MNLVDHNLKAIPVCNYIDTSGSHMHLEDVKYYNDHVKQGELSLSMAFLTCAVTLLFVCIFTLNFSAGIWSSGNLLTFLLIIIFGLSTMYAVKKYNIANVILNNLKNEGGSCTTVEQENTIMYCNSSNGF